jgi:hypothetical protein
LRKTWNIKINKILNWHPLIEAFAKQTMSRLAETFVIYHTYDLEKELAKISICIL